MLLSSLRKLIEEKTGETNFSLGEPEVKGRGNFATNVAFLLAKKRGVSPLTAAEELKSKLRDNKLFEKVEVAQPGFVNFWISRKSVAKEFQEIVGAKTKWGRPKVLKKELVIVEYSSPNVAKPMHVGHLRSTIIGDALANIYEFLGYKVIRWNYIGDWGTQFGKLTAAYKMWGNKKELEANPIQTMLKLYVRFHEEAKKEPSLEKKGQEEFRKLEECNRENKKLWEWFRRESLKDFNRLYKVLDVKFDITAGESFYEKDLKPLIERLEKSGVAQKSEGALIIPLDNMGLPPALIRKSDEASLYITRDIANLEYRLKKYKPAKILYVVANEQALHFSQLFAVAKIMGFTSTEVQHIKFGMVLGSDGKKLSTREGKIIILDDLISEGVKLAYQEVQKKNPKLRALEKQKIATAVGIGAIKYNDLSQNRGGDITFNWEKMLSFIGNSAPYLQYTYARLRSVLKKGKVGKFDAKLLSDAERYIILKLSQFPEAVKRGAESNLPNHLADYLYDLAQLANNYYEVNPILQSEPKVRAVRLNLIKAVAETLKNGLNLLGIQTLERM
ncbi:MAG: arginine--tRNA ligase [Parcubacteria group bacterium CG1_02_42_13]|nr:MAG: arginine--tRNA ligase [Parcubacteria group bacterium CG1_02_42_13]